MEKVKWRYTPLLKEGLWNGEIPVLFTAVEYEVGKSPSVTWWSSTHFGEIRQGIYVKNPVDGHEFLIDNKFGDGYQCLITKSIARNNCKRVINGIIIQHPLPFEVWNKRVDLEGIDMEARIRRAKTKALHPIEFEQLQVLIEGFHGKI